jgi:hypothetical protein
MFIPPIPVGLARRGAPTSLPPPEAALLSPSKIHNQKSKINIRHSSFVIRHSSFVIRQFFTSPSNHPQTEADPEIRARG